MDSKTSKANRPAVITPRIPEDIIDEILDHLAADSDFKSLRACALLSRSWVPSSRRHLFHTVDLTWGKMDRWYNTFPVPEESPAHHVLVLHISNNAIDWVPVKFFDHAPRFTNVRKLFLFGGEHCAGPRVPSLWKLPESVTSLAISASNGASLVKIWEIVAQLPNLDDLSLQGRFIQADRSALLGIGTVPRGRFGGKLVLRNVYGAGRGHIEFLEILTGSPFSRVEIDYAREYIPAVIRLVEACSQTIVKLSLNVRYSGKYHSSSS